MEWGAASKRTLDGCATKAWVLIVGDSFKVVLRPIYLGLRGQSRIKGSPCLGIMSCIGEMGLRTTMPKSNSSAALLSRFAMYVQGGCCRPKSVLGAKVNMLPRQTNDVTLQIKPSYDPPSI